MKLINEQIGLSFCDMLSNFYIEFLAMYSYKNSVCQYKIYINSFFGDVHYVKLIFESEFLSFNICGLQIITYI